MWVKGIGKIVPFPEKCLGYERKINKWKEVKTIMI